ncbi:MAG: hypothetical protein FWD28_04325 [Treponema sp.]|nr:hypothetical protein [Treponema sp.]
MKKKILILVLISAFLFTLVGCLSLGGSTRCSTCYGRGYTEGDAFINNEGGISNIRKTCGACFGTGR